MNAIHPPVEPAVIFEAVTVALSGVSILESVSACVPRGSNTAIVGPNGAGKTTLLLALLGQVPYAGGIRLAGRAGGGPARIGYVPQRLVFDRGMPLTVLEFLVMGLQRLPVWFGLRRALRDRALILLDTVRVKDLANRGVGMLSGGELQRVLLALALEQEPDLLVLDEPAAGVDVQGEQIFCEVLEALQQAHGFTQLMVSHDLSMVTAHATHVICLNKRVTGEGAPRATLTSEVLTDTFGLHMGLVDSRSMPSQDPSYAAPCCREEEPHA